MIVEQADTEVDIPAVRAALLLEGAVINRDPASAEHQICYALFMKLFFASPGAGVYYGNVAGEYRLELGSAYRYKTAVDFRVGLPMIDSRIDYLRHEYIADRVLVYFEIKE